MNLPDQPPTFRQPSAAERPWWWRLEDAAGAEVEAPSLRRPALRDARPTPSPGWARSGPTWPAEGVDAVTLFEHERQVYGPMSLHA